MHFFPGMNCFIGRNGQGKTNLLEAIYYLSLLRSFRTPNLNDLRQVQTDFFRLEGVVEEEGFSHQLAVSYGAERHLKKNGFPVYRATEFINQFLCVTLIPEDLNFVQGAPAQRRRFLDIAISQMSPAYLHSLQRYVEALHSRNVMLRQSGKYARTAIQAYDEILAKSGAEIELARFLFCEKINENLREISQEVLQNAQNQRVFSVKYLAKMGSLMQEPDSTQLEELQNKLRLALDASYERDCAAQMTQIGPHRSDFSCLLQDRRMLHFASQGECRLASLSLRMACLKELEKRVGLSKLVLLIDDVFGELDAERKKLFFSCVQNVGQIFFAATELPQDLQFPHHDFFIQGGKCSL